jgi:glycosyltransferase involved in cell wall biosynthesis
MSTYQGERYVREQLLSILSQLPPGGRIIVRDDGSHDQTVNEVAAFDDDRITLHRGSNLGFGPSFLTLLTLTPGDADVVMFSDQDDVWLPGKIDRAWQHLHKFDGHPALYASAQMLTDKDLRPLNATRPWPRPPSLANALMENIVTGCTAAINRPAIDLLQRAGVPAGVRFHDWWLYLVLSAFGTVVYDEQPTLLYRQHGRNVIGHGSGWLNRQLRMASFLLRHDWVGILLGQAQALLRCYGESLPTQTRDWMLAHFRFDGTAPEPRWRLIFEPRCSRQISLHELPLRLLLALHKLGLRRSANSIL